MALVIATQEPIYLPMNLVIFTIGLIVFLFLIIIFLWLQLQKFQKIAAQRKNQLNQILTHNSSLKTVVATSVSRQPHVPSFVHTNRATKPPQKFYQQPLHTQISNKPRLNTRVTKPSSLKVKKSRRLLLLAIILAMLTGTAIALIQFGNILIASEYYLPLGLGMGFLILIGAIAVR